MTGSLVVLAFLIASAPYPPHSVESLLKEKLLAPLAARDEARSRYSRAEPPLAERRLRILDDAPITDGKGGAFVGFAVDARHRGSKQPWRSNAIAGCVYPRTGEVYVRHGKGYRPATILLGKWAPLAPGHVCRGTLAAG